MSSQMTSGTHKEYKPVQKVKSLLDIPITQYFTRSFTKLLFKTSKT